MAPHELLGIPPDATEEAVRAAYADKVKADHPDHGGAGIGLAALKKARDDMLSRPTRKAPCRVCNETGWVRTGGFKPERCPRGC